MPKRLLCMPPRCTWVTIEQRCGARFQLSTHVHTSLVPSIVKQKEPKLAIFCTVMVHFHILVHCIFALTFASPGFELHMGHNRKTIRCWF